MKFLYNDNVIKLRDYRTYKEALKILAPYKTRLLKMTQEEFQEEKRRLAYEWAANHGHMLTLTKIEIFKGVRDGRPAGAGSAEPK